MDLYSREQITILELKQEAYNIAAKHSLQVTKLISLQQRFVEQLFTAFESVAANEEVNFGNKKYTPTTELKWHIKTLRANALNQLKDAQLESITPRSQS
tara:strand:- start:258 stop:554 length:297 start_codon:yes stop_codon:yes gene_type:complete